MKLLRVLLATGLMGCSSMPQKPPVPIHVPVLFAGAVCNSHAKNMWDLKPELKLARIPEAYVIYQYAKCWSA